MSTTFFNQPGTISDLSRDMSNDWYVKAILYITVAVWAIVLFLDGQKVTYAWLQPLSTVTTVVLFIVMAFDLWLWKLSLLHGWFVKRPIIDGTWKVQLRSNWMDPSTKTKMPPIEGYMIVRESFSTLKMSLITSESSSELVGTEITCSSDGTYCISGVYRNEPRYSIRERSVIHYGAVWLKVVDQRQQRIDSHYWTDRGTAGEIEMTARQSRRFHDFNSAKSYFDDLRVGV